MSAVKTTPKTIKPAAKATKASHPYQVDEYGYPSPVGMKDAPKPGGIWDDVSGRALVTDLFAWRDVLTEQQANDNVNEEIRGLMAEALMELSKPYDETKRPDIRGIAIGVLAGLTELVAYALESKDVREFMVKRLSDTVQLYNEIEAAELEHDRTLALDIHGLARKKGGPLHE
jgi:hypothetical protein